MDFQGVPRTVLASPPGINQDIARNISNKFAVKYFTHYHASSNNTRTGINNDATCDSTLLSLADMGLNSMLTNVHNNVFLGKSL